jgi:hypothetical protein
MDWKATENTDSMIPTISVHLPEPTLASPIPPTHPSALPLAHD